MRLTPDVVLVGGGAYTGFGVSAGFDAHCYLLDGGDEVALVDCGTGTEEAMERLLSNVRAAGLDSGGIDRLFLTHFHTDHAGGAARYRERLGCAVAISADAATALETADHEATSLAPGQRTGLFPADFDYPPCPVADRLADGDERTVGRLTVRFLATPGHCAGHGSYLVTGGGRTYLLAGDAVFAWGKVAVLATADCDLQALLESVRRLAGEEFDALLPGHAQIVLDGGRAHVEQAKATVDALTVPPNWFSYEEVHVIKVIGTAYKRDDFSHDEFFRYWRDVHAPISAAAPGLRGYVVTEIVRKLQGDLDVDAFVSQWWDDEEAMERALASDEVEAAWEDVPKYAKTTGTFWVTKEHVYMPHPVLGAGTLSHEAWIA